MKIQFTRVLASLGAASVLAVAASADELIQNGNFGVAAGTLNHWSHNGTLTDLGGTTNVDFASASSQHSHSTRFSADMGIENFSNTTFHEELQQNFAPVAANKVTEISLWGFSFEQTLKVNLLYSDNTSTSVFSVFDHAPLEATDPDGGWQKWDLLGSLDLSKTLVGIRISADSGNFNDGNDIFVDDVSVKANLPSAPAPVAALPFVAGLWRRRRKA